MIIFLDDFISKKGVGERRRTEGGRTGALRRDGGGRVGARPREKLWGKWGPPCPDRVLPAQAVSSS